MAQTTHRPTIAVARTVTVQPPARVALKIRAGKVPPSSFVRLRGLPPMAALSEGHAIAPGTWAVPLNALADLAVAVPANATGSAEVMVALMSADGSVLDEARFTLVILASSAPPTSLYDRQRAIQYLEKGKEQLAQGLVAPARLLYERAADLGLAEAAMALAETYDPAALDRSHLRGVEPDIKEARRWYERALALGDADAGKRLQRLGRE